MTMAQNIYTLSSLYSLPAQPSKHFPMLKQWGAGKQEYSI